MNSIKTTVFNLIILDESGSMGYLTDSTISGCNEVLSTIRNAQAQEDDDDVRNLVSIYAFQSWGRSRYIIKNKPIDQVEDITRADYRPCAGTPLLDAIGSTLSDLFAVAATHEDPNAIITIITDGLENASESYTPEKVASLISRAKEMGWTVNLIGANIDVDDIGSQLNISNRMRWRASRQGTKDMYSNLSRNVGIQFCLRREEKNMDVASRIQARKKRAANFFNHPDTDTKHDK